ncbi:MAG: hypothetical protein WCJ30_06655 [Deltaproteobacteria bacterium]
MPSLEHAAIERWWQHHRQVWISFADDFARVVAACRERAAEDPLAIVTDEGIAFCESAEERAYVVTRLADPAAFGSPWIVPLHFERGCVYLEFEFASSSNRQREFVRWLLGRFTVAAIRNESAADLMPPT